MSERTQIKAMENLEVPRLDASISINLARQLSASTSPIPHPDEWPVVRLADITLKIGSGATPRGGSENYLPERVSFALIRSQNVFDRHFDCAGLAFISNEQAQGLQNVIVQPNDLLLNITGDGITFARCCAVPEDVLPACVNQHVSIIRVDPSLADPGYVLAYLTHPSVKAYIESFNAGGSRRAITKGHIESFRLPLPPLSEQHEIALMLGKLDDKIELNRKMNEALEAMARALFKSWFVEFDPVRAKAEGRDTGLPAHIAALFPDSFGYSEQGEIPDGWGLTPLHEIAEFANGAAYRDMHFSQSNDGLPVIKIAELKSGVTGTTRFTRTNLGERYRIDSRDILFSWSGNPDTSIDTFVWDGGPAWLNQHIFRVRAREDWSRVRTYCQLRLLRPVFAEIARNKQTTGLGHVTIADMKRLFVCRPPEPVTEAFDRYANPVFERMITNQSEIRTLTILRDTLLPKLISGELRIPQTDHAMEAHI